MSPSLPEIVAGPILRHCNNNHFTVWLITTNPNYFHCKLFNDESSFFDRKLTKDEFTQVQVGTFAFINLIHLTLEEPLPNHCPINYNLGISSSIDADEIKWLEDCISDLTYKSHLTPHFSIEPNVENMFHGSCRKPHFDSIDGLTIVDNELAKFAEQSRQTQKQNEKHPSMLMLSGDQIYADDVAGPMLDAIHQVMHLLGLFDESWQGAIVNNTQELLAHANCFYNRHQLLPHDSENKAVYDKMFAASKKPIFTSVNSANHLVTFSEVIAMYALSWSPALWETVNLSKTFINLKEQQLYDKELKVINKFSKELFKVRRALAHIPTYMIFDDHDITDDWNLTRGWEETAYGNPFSKRIIGNTLIGYWLCQGWGNAPEKFNSLTTDIERRFTAQGLVEQDTLIDELIAWNQWHYHLNTSPKVVVLDTRTQRWRSESKANKPSGLMDWESLSNLQQELIGQPSVIMVSPAPIYGVKLIEVIQRIFTFFGQPLMVDAENWMAHKGTANVILNIFQHPKTPPNFIILSGDVHYSFVYEVTHRFRRNRSKILQITCSGIKNQFPDKLLHTLDKLNRYLYATYSPLNWFTKRRRMKIRVRKPFENKRSHLLNQSGIGQILIEDDGKKVEASVLVENDKKIIFKKTKNKLN